MLRPTARSETSTPQIGASAPQSSAPAGRIGRDLKAKEPADELEAAPAARTEITPSARGASSSPGVLAGLFSRAVSAVMIGATGLALTFGPGVPLAHAQEVTPAPITAPVEVEPTRTPIRAPDAPEPRKLDMPRAPVRIELSSPLTSTSTHASHYALLPRAMGYGLDRLTEKYPEIDRTFAARFLELAMSVGVEVPWMVLSHEAGHYRVADSFGWKPEIEMTGWMSGLTRYTFPAGEKDPTGTRRLMASAAGVNQEQINAGEIYEHWARNGSVRYQEALAYLLAQTNLALYAGRTATKDPSEISGSDDIASYVSRMNARGERLTTGQLVAVAAAADLLSAPVWASVIGQARFLANGDRRVEIPRFQLGGVEATFPSFSTLLTSEGPVVGGRMLIDPRGKVPVQLSLDVRLDGEAFAVGAKAYDIQLAKDLRVNPFVRVTAGNDQPAGALVGAEVSYSPVDKVSLMATATFQTRDLLAEPEGRKDGLSLGVGVGLSF